MSSVDGDGSSTPDREAETGELDYWSFVTLAKQRVGERLNIADVDSSHLALSLNRPPESSPMLRSPRFIDR